MPASRGLRDDDDAAPEISGVKIDVTVRSNASEENSGQTRRSPRLYCPGPPDVIDEAAVLDHHAFGVPVEPEVEMT